MRAMRSAYIYIYIGSSTIKDTTISKIFGISDFAGGSGRAGGLYKAHRPGENDEVFYDGRL